MPFNILIGQNNIMNFNSALVVIVDSLFMLIGLTFIWAGLKLKLTKQPILEAQTV